MSFTFKRQDHVGCLVLKQSTDENLVVVKKKKKKMLDSVVALGVKPWLFDKNIDTNVVVRDEIVVLS